MFEVGPPAPSRHNRRDAPPCPRRLDRRADPHPGSHPQPRRRGRPRGRLRVHGGLAALARPGRARAALCCGRAPRHLRRDRGHGARTLDRARRHARHRRFRRPRVVDLRPHRSPGGRRVAVRARQRRFQGRGGDLCAPAGATGARARLRRPHRRALRLRRTQRPLRRRARVLRPPPRAPGPAAAGRRADRLSRHRPDRGRMPRLRALPAAGARRRRALGRRAGARRQRDRARAATGAAIAGAAAACGDRGLRAARAAHPHRHPRRRRGLLAGTRPVRAEARPAPDPRLRRRRGARGDQPRRARGRRAVPAGRADADRVGGRLAGLSRARRASAGGRDARGLSCAAGADVPAAIVGASNIGNYLATLGVPALCGFGVRDEGIHAADERIELASIGSVYNVYRAALERLHRPTAGA